MAAENFEFDGVEVPRSFICPITQEPMQDPVMTCDGHSFERTAVEAWFAIGRTTNPLHGGPLENVSLTPNFALRGAIDEFRESLLQGDAPVILDPKVLPNADNIEELVMDIYRRKIVEYTESYDDNGGAKFLFKRASTYDSLKEYASAARDFTQYLRECPDDCMARACRGRAFFEMGSFQPAIVDLTRAIDEGMKTVDSYAVRAACYIQRGELDNAAADLSVIPHDQENDFAREQMELLEAARNTPQP